LKCYEIHDNFLTKKKTKKKQSLSRPTMNAGFLIVGIWKKGQYLDGSE